MKYFKDMYKDLSTIKSTPLHSGAYFIDRNAFTEFVNCPGIVSDRLFALACKGNKDERIEEANFVRLMLEIYSSDLDGKMNLVFKVFDFDNDSFITAEDVRMILSYIPRQRDQCSSLEIKDDDTNVATPGKPTNTSDTKKSRRETKPSLGGKKKKRGEGLYFSSMGKNDDENDRKNDTEKI